MALVLKDRVKEQTTTTGTGAVTLGGAISGFDTFAAVGNSNTTYYAIVSQSANEWEVGLGTYTASGTTLSRDTILESSNSDAAVNFSAGTKDVFVTYPADKSVYADAAGTVNAGAIAATSLTLTTDLAVAEGGTGAGTFAANGILYGNGTSAIGATAVGTATHVLTSNGAGVAPTFQAAAAGGATDIDGLSDGFTSGTSALYLGTGVGNSNTAANTAVGEQSLQSITGTNGGVVAFGWKAGKSNAGGYRNTFIGATAADNVTTGSKNVLMGYDVSKTLTTGSQNVIIGSQAAENLSTGGGNTIIGENTGVATDTNANCIIMGQGAASSSNSVANEITLGNTTVDKFRIPGINFIIKDSTATEDYVLTVDASGEAGWEAAAAGGATDIDGLSDALTNSSGGTVGLGTGALAADDGSANLNTALGFDALNDVVTGQRNVAVGHSAGSKVTSGNNTFIGERAGQLLVTGSENTAVGSAAMISAVTGNGNSAFGYAALGGGSGTSMGQNVGVGYYAGAAITTGDGNTVVGYDNGATNVLTTGSNNIILGNLTSASSATVSNEITLGNASVTSFRIPGVDFYNLNSNVGIGTSSPAVPLDVVGNIRSSTGVLFGTDTAAANLLDDYEEGDWTPTIGTGSTVSSDAAYNASFTAGKYTKVGRVVHCTATLRLTDKGSQSGAISILGLPFASANNVGSRATWSSWFHGAADIDLTGNVTGTIMMYQGGNTAYIIVRVKDPATASAENVEFADISDTVYVQISGSYIAA